MFIDKNGGLYIGDMRDGDRPATVEEQASGELARMAIVVEARLATIKVLREAAINRINGIADREQRGGNPSIRAVGDVTVLALIAMTKNLPEDPTMVDGVLTERYAAIVGPLAETAPELLSAFAEMDA